jgi:hypothetical protein
MIRAYRSRGTRLEPLDLTSGHLRDALWIDLEAPDRAEEDAVGGRFGRWYSDPRGHAGDRGFVPLLPRGEALFLTVQVLETPKRATPRSAR